MILLSRPSSTAVLTAVENGGAASVASVVGMNRLDVLEIDSVVNVSTPTAFEFALERRMHFAMNPTRPRLLLLNASLAGEEGNTAVLLARAKQMIAQRATVELVTLSAGGGMTFEQLRPQLESADGFLFGTGTHWDSWSSVLQRFLEEATPAEATALWLGKPAVVVVSEHSVGGKAVLSRLQGVLVTLGCLIPPMGGLVVSKAVRIAAAHDATTGRDLWSDEDLAVVCENLTEAARASQPGASPARWRAWSVERDDISARWV